jgi:vacuolar-type H+-ATPase subunit I/STV1
MEIVVFRVLLLGFLVFTVSLVVVPTQVYAISLDDEEEDAEDVADLLDAAKKAAKSESFTKANALLKKAKMYGTSSSDVSEVQKYVSAKKRARDERIERERKERERLARLKREKEERERAAQQNYNTRTYSSGAISVCYPSIPRPIDYTECSGAKTASGKYATVKLDRGGGMSSENCFDLNIYASGTIGVANTCGGVNGGWSVMVNGQSGYANGLGNAIAWLLRRM